MELYHHGVKGQRWGVRRYQNADGTLTAAGKNRYRGKNGDITRYKEGTKEYLDTGKQAWDIVRGRGSSRSSELLKKYGEAHREKIVQARVAIGNSKAEQERIDKLEKLTRQSAELAKSHRLFRRKKMAKLALEDRKLRNEIWDLKDPETAAVRAKRHEALNRLAKEYVDKKSSVVLRELGYDDTKKARRYVQSMWDYAVVTMLEEETFKTKAK